MDLFQGATWKIKSTGGPYVPAWRNKALGMTQFDILLNNGSDEVHYSTDLQSELFDTLKWEATFSKEYSLDTSTRNLLPELISQMHPTRQSSELCGAVFLTTVSWDPYEILIPCNQTIAKTIIICTAFPIQNYSISQKSNEKYPFSTHITQQGLTLQPFRCSGPWIPLGNQCLQIVKLEVESMKDVTQLSLHCSRHNSSVYKEHENSDFGTKIQWFLKTYTIDKEMILKFWVSNPHISYYMVFKHFKRLLGQWQEATIYNHVEAPQNIVS